MRPQFTLRFYNNKKPSSIPALKAPFLLTQFTKTNQVVGTSKSQPKSWLLSNIGTKTAMQVIEEVAAENFLLLNPSSKAN